jgi:hypothetical protein
VAESNLFAETAHGIRQIQRMTLDELRALSRRSSMEPLIIRLTDGRGLRVSHPEFLGIPHDGASFVYFAETGGWEFVFLDQVVSVDSAKREHRGKPA